MTLHDELVEIVALLGVQAAEAKIVKDNKIRRQVATEDLVVCAVRTCLTELGEQRIGANEHHRVTGTHSSGPQALSQQRLADADGPDEDAMLLTRQELQREHVLQLAPIELDWGGPVEAVQRHAVLETGLQQVRVRALAGRDAGPRRPAAR